MGILLLCLALVDCSGFGSQRVVHPPGYPLGYVERGEASWYGPGFHGNKTANGETYDMHQLTAAHRTLPLGSVAVVRSLANGREVTVRINDRGPFARGRILDLSLASAQALQMVGTGTADIELRVIDYQGRLDRLAPLRVQLATFSEVSNAHALLMQLEVDRYPARLVHSLDHGRRLYRVQAGYFHSEGEAQAAAQRLGTKYSVDPIVVRDETP
ncbi:MAG: septal ring lytic transglycosylase RlpA family protein [Nitrospiraceae bacterium]